MRGRGGPPENLDDTWAGRSGRHSAPPAWGTGDDDPGWPAGGQAGPGRASQPGRDGPYGRGEAAPGWPAPESAVPYSAAPSSGWPAPESAAPYPGRRRPLAGGAPEDEWLTPGTGSGTSAPEGRGAGTGPDRWEQDRGVTARGEALRRAATGAGGARSSTAGLVERTELLGVVPDVSGRSDGDEDRRDRRDRGAGGAGRSGDRPGPKTMPLWQELPLLLVVAFCLAVLIRTFLLQAFFIPSGSMEDTLLVGDRVLVNKVVYDVRAPHRGEVVVFRGPSNWVPETPTGPQGSFVSRLGRTVGDLVGVSTPGEKDFIKRVIGLPGDTVACCDAQGRVTVNGIPLDEPYVIENSSLDVAPNPNECRSRRFGPVTVEEGQMWVMGDHRAVSQDSRCQGQVPIENVIGRAFAVVWPSDRWATLPVPSTFDKVTQPVAAGPVEPGHHRTKSSIVDSSGGGPPGSGGPEAIAVILPLLLSGCVPARSGTGRRRRRRRLAA